MKRKTLLLSAVAAALAVATLSVAAQQITLHPIPRHEPQAGPYAYTNDISCLVSTAGFNANLTPLAGGAVFVQSLSGWGIVTINGDGTGTQETTREVQLVYPPTGPSTVSSNENSGPFTYAVASDGTLTLDPGTLDGTLLSGPSAGATFTVVGRPSLAGRMTRSGILVLGNAGSPAVETLTVSGSAGSTVLPRICNRRFVVVPVQ